MRVGRAGNVATAPAGMSYAGPPSIPYRSGIAPRSLSAAMASSP